MKIQIQPYVPVQPFALYWNLWAGWIAIHLFGRQIFLIWKE